MTAWSITCDLFMEHSRAKTDEGADILKKRVTLLVPKTVLTYGRNFPITFRKKDRAARTIGLF